MSCPVGGPCIYSGCATYGCGKMRTSNVLPKESVQPKDIFDQMYDKERGSKEKLQPSDAGEAAALYSKLYHDEKRKRESLERELTEARIYNREAFDRIKALEAAQSARATNWRDEAYRDRLLAIAEGIGDGSDPDVDAEDAAFLRELARTSATVERSSKT